MLNEIKNKTKERYGIIYIIRNKINNKMYIGQTINQRGFDGRYPGDLERSSDNGHLKYSIRKYGIENFEIIKEFDVAYSKEELDKLEDLYIKTYNTTNEKYGYNKKFGGAGGSLTKETKLKLSKSLKRYFKNNENPMSGRNHTIESRKKMSDSHKGKYTGEDAYNSKAVICVTTMKEYLCGVYACEYYNMSAATLSECCSGNREFGGRCKNTGIQLRWMYLEDWNKLTLLEREKEIMKPISKDGAKVICINTLEIFYNSTEAKEKYPQSHAISSCCVGNAKYTGMLDDGTPIRWMYLYDWLNITEEEKIKIKNEELNMFNSTEIYCVTTKKQFNSITEAGEFYSVAPTSIGCVAKHFGVKSAGKLEDGTPLLWMYLDEWNVLDNNKKEEFYNMSLNYKININKGNRIKKVICITTGLTFNMAKDGAEYYGIDSSSIVKCCKGKLSKCGNLPDGTPLVWRYLNEYLQTA